MWMKRAIPILVAPWTLSLGLGVGRYFFLCYPPLGELTWNMKSSKIEFSNNLASISIFEFHVVHFPGWKITSYFWNHLWFGKDRLGPHVPPSWWRFFFFLFRGDVVDPSRVGEPRCPTTQSTKATRWSDGISRISIMTISRKQHFWEGELEVSRKWPFTFSLPPVREWFEWLHQRWIFSTRFEPNLVPYDCNMEVIFWGHLTSPVSIG